MESPELIIALLIVLERGSRANSYGLCRLLSRAFGIINCKEIIDSLVGNDYVQKLDDSQVPEFAVTAKGMALITLYKQNAIAAMKQDRFCQNDFSIFIMDNL